MSLFIRIFCFALLISTVACKSNPNKSNGDAVTEAGGDQSDKYRPHDGFSPVPYGVSLDPRKYEKLVAALGTTDFKKVNQINMTPELNEQWNQQAKSLIESRRAEDGNRTNAALTSQFWVIDGIYKDTMANPQIYAGKWVKFEANDTYTYGTYDQNTGSGTYHYKLSTDQIIMVDNDPQAKALEFDVQYQAGFIVFYGTKTFDDYEIQMKLMGRHEKPQKP